MQFELECVEWTNVNRNAKLIKKKKNKNNSEAASECLYLTQIVGKEESDENESKLGCLCSNQIVHIYEQSNLKLKSQLFYPHGEETNSNTNDFGFFKQPSSNNMFSCGDDGKLKIWDLRLTNDGKTSTSVNCFEDSSQTKIEFLCADINSNDTLLIAGTNKVIDSSYIYIFDIRNSGKYLLKLSESHSSDITQVKFNHNNANKFASGGIDGLVCLFDLDQKSDPIEKTESDSESDSEPSDPDLMFQCFNTMSSVSKLGYLENELFSITLNGLFVYDLTTDDLLHKSSDLNTSQEDEENEDYILDCLYLKNNQNQNILTNLMGTKNGNIKFFNKDNLLVETKRDSVNKSERFHKDVIRSSYWNSKNLYTVGEDGFLLKWKVGQKTTKKRDENDIKNHRKRDISINSRKIEAESNKEEKNIKKKRFFK